MLTQNVDNLLEAAGCSDVTHLHGELTTMKCTACGNIWDVGYLAWNPNTDRCPKCNSRKGVKPGVVFFNENAPEYATLYHVMKHLNELSTIVVIGTTGLVIDIQSLIFDRPGVKILNNLDPVASINADYFDHVFYESADVACDKIDVIVKQRMESPQG